MSSILPLLLALLQGPGLQVSAAADRNHLAVGDTLGLVIRATSSESDPIRVILPALDGFALIARRETTSRAGGRNLVVIDLQLLATRGGQWRLTPIRVFQRLQTVVVPPIDVQVDGPDTVQVAPRSPAVARVVERTPAPTPEEVSVYTVISQDTAYVGEQVELATSAWFPRTLLSRLRRPPTLKPPTVDGVWNLPEPVAPGVASSRSVSGEWYDLFISRQLFFPLTPGRIRIPEATLTFAVPQGRQFFSDERPYQLMSRPTSLVVRPVPPRQDGRPAGPTARSLAARYELPRDVVAAGELGTVAVVLEGQGNLALWPAPAVTWPAGVRVYPERVEDFPETTGGVAGGRKVFRFSLLADTPGPVVLPELSYGYFDPRAGRHVDVTAPPAVLSIAPPRRLASGRKRPALLAVPTRPAAARLWDAVPVAVLIPTLLLPVLAWGWRRRPRRGRVVPRRPWEDDPRGAFDEVLGAWVARGVERESEVITVVLREGGVPRETAARVGETYGALRREEYGPPAPARRDQRTMRDALLALARDLARWRRPVGVLLLILGGAGAATGQTLSPDSLYRAGQVRAALAGYERVLQRSPDSVGVWYRVGLARFALGDDAGSAAALLYARQLSPRSQVVRAAWQMVADSAHLGVVPRVWPLVPAELWVLAAVAWIAGWTVLAWRPRGDVRLGRGLLVLGVVALGLGVVVARGAHRDAVVVRPNAVLRIAPHGLAAEVAPAPAFAILPIEARAGGWVRVRVAANARGWLAPDAVAEVGPPARTQ